MDCCRAIKANGSRCKQRGKDNQNGGKIISGFCEFHKTLRDQMEDPNLIKIKKMSDEEITEFVNTLLLEEKTSQIIKYILDRSNGDIEGREQSDIWELFEQEHQVYDGIKYGREFCPEFLKCVMMTS